MSQKSYHPQPIPPVDKPLSVELSGDEVVIIGPGRIAFSMTRQAAADTCKRLSELLESEDPE